MKANTKKAEVREFGTLAGRDAKVVKGCRGIKLARSTVAVRAGQIVYKTKNAVAVFDGKSGRRVQWIRTKRVKGLVK